MESESKMVVITDVTSKNARVKARLGSVSPLVSLTLELPPRMPLLRLLPLLACLATTPRALSLAAPRAPPLPQAQTGSDASTKQRCRGEFL
jgi:hypothetical protein